MFLYFYIFMCLSFFCLISLGQNAKLYRSYTLFFTLVILTLFSGLRSSKVGSDYLNYKEIFNSFSGKGIKEVVEGDYFFEPGFALLIVLIRFIVEHHVVFFLMISLITSTFMYISLKRLAVYPLLSILIFFSYDYFTNYMVAIRFGMATALGLTVLYQISLGKRKLAFIFILLSMAIHTAAIGLVIPFIISFFKLSRLRILLVIISSLILGYLSIGQLVVSNILPNWIPRADSAATYASDSMYGNTLGYLSFINIKYLLISIVLYIYYDTLSSKIKHFNALTIFLISAMAVRVSFHDLGFISGRVSALLGIAEIILIPSIALILIKQSLAAFLSVFIYALIHIIFILFIRGFSEYSFFIT